MKKSVCIILCCLVLVGCLSACSINVLEDALDAMLCGSYTVKGLENFPESSKSPALNFLPNGEKLWEKYEYIEGDFYHHKRTFISAADVVHEEGIVHVSFDEETYFTAKQFVWENFDLSDEKSFLYKEHCFYEITSDYSAEMTFESPLSFALVAFDDDSGRILFLGFYAFPPIQESKEALQQFGEGNPEPFFEEYFPMYDFSE